VSRQLKAAIAGLALAGLPGSAAAGFHVCNQTAFAVNVALGFYDGEAWGSQGWWRVEGGGCTELVSEPLPARYYYLYATHEEVGGAWDGNRSFCVGSASFRISGRGDCLARGFDRKRFFQVDTRDAMDWTETLSD
jgi:uncharacterized membrane protein